MTLQVSILEILKFGGKRNHSELSSFDTQETKKPNYMAASQGSFRLLEEEFAQCSTPV
jgi:hypothetical protein